MGGEWKGEGRVGEHYCQVWSFGLDRKGIEYIVDIRGKAYLYLTQIVEEVKEIHSHTLISEPKQQ